MLNLGGEEHDHDDAHTDDEPHRSGPTPRQSHQNEHHRNSSWDTVRYYNVCLGHHEKSMHATEIESFRV